MSSETELKLNVPPARLGAIAARPWLKRLERGQPATERLVSVYFDTSTYALRERHLALRVRRVGDKYLQTVKRGMSTVDREEWEKEILGELPRRELARQTALKHFTSKKKWRKLRPVFETKVQRTSFPVRFGGAVIEMALDKGKLSADGRAQPVSEVELELRDGDIGAVANLARRLAESTPASLNLRSKAERGYALAASDTNLPLKAPDVGVAASQNAAQGFTTIALSCLQHLTANQAAVLSGDPEGIHQMRVGLRRLRAALSLFRELLRGKDTERIEKDLKWLSAQLGPARDFDVFVQDSLARMERQDGRHAPLKSLKHSLASRRAWGMARAKRVVAGDRYRRVILEAGLWAIAGGWTRNSDDM